MAVWRIRESICIIISVAEGEPGPAEEGCRQHVAILQEGVWGVHALTSFRSHRLICKCLLWDKANWKPKDKGACGCTRYRLFFQGRKQG